MYNRGNEKTILKTASPRVRRRLLYTAVALAVGIALILCNQLTSLLPWGARTFALEEKSMYGVSSPSKFALSSIDRDVRLYFVTEDGDINLDRDLYSFLKTYETLSTHISVDTVSTKADPDFLAERGFDLPGEPAFLVESDRRCRLLTVSELFYYQIVNNTESEPVIMELSPDEYAAYGQGFVNSGCTVTPYFCGEEGITNAISFVLREEVPTVALLESEGNYAVEASWVTRLWQLGYRVDRIVSTEDLGEEHDLLLYNTPLIDISDPEAEALSAWLANGGDMMLSTYYHAGVPENLAKILAQYGLSADERNVRVVENNANYALSGGSYMVAKISSLHAATGSFNGAFIAVDAHAIRIESVEGVQTTSWLYSTEQGSRERYDPATDSFTDIEEERGVYTYGAIAERGESTVIWVSSPHVFSRDFDIIAEGGNYSLMTSALDWSCGVDSEEGRVDVDPRILSASYLLMSWTPFVIWTVVLVGVLPLSLLAIGLIRYYIKKKRI